MTANASSNINTPEILALGLFLSIDAAGATVGLVFSSNFSYLFPIIVGLANTIFIIAGQYFGSILKTMPGLQKRGGKMKLYSYLKMLQEKGINTFPEEQVRQEMLTTPVPEISLTQDGLCGVRLGKDGKDWVAFVTNSFEERPDLLPNGKRGQVIEP